MPVPRRSNESGFALIEVVVSAALVALIGVGVFIGFDSASKASGQSKQRNLAATVAQQEMERLRGMSYARLKTLNSTRTVSLCDEATSGDHACIPFTVQSSSATVQTGSTPPSCTSSGDQAYDLRVTTTVTWPGMNTGRPPVRSTSLVATPPGGASGSDGSISLRILRADGTTGVSGVSVAAAGPSNANGTTDATGCVVFGSLPAGSYTLSFGQNGWIDPNGTQNVTKSVAVAAGQLTSVTHSYDQAATVNVSFSAGGTASKMDRITFVRAGQPDRSFGTPGSFVSTISATGLFPYPTWNVYAGDCSAMAPPTPATVSGITGGGTVNYTLGMAKLAFVSPGIRNNGSNYGAPDPRAPYVKLKGTGTCAAWSFRQQVDASGQPVSPGVPYGTFGLCADADVTSDSWNNQPLSNQTFGTAGTITLAAQNIRKQDTDGPCP